MKKKEIVIGVSVLISASLPISVYAASNESMSSRGFIIDETNEFECSCNDMQQLQTYN